VKWRKKKEKKRRRRRRSFIALNVKPIEASHGTLLRDQASPAKYLLQI
jgi:hypothetical protein